MFDLQEIYVFLGIDFSFLYTFRMLKTINGIQLRLKFMLNLVFGFFFFRRRRFGRFVASNMYFR